MQSECLQCSWNDFLGTRGTRNRHISCPCRQARLCSFPRTCESGGEREERALTVVVVPSVVTATTRQNSTRLKLDKVHECRRTADTRRRRQSRRRQKRVGIRDFFRSDEGRCATRTHPLSPARKGCWPARIGCKDFRRRDSAASGRAHNTLKDEPPLFPPQPPGIRSIHSLVSLF